MAELSSSDVLKLARLARLKLTDEEVKKYQTELSEILEYVKILDNVDVAGLQPTYQITGLINVARKDKIKDYGVSQADLLKNVPKTLDKQIRVNRMIA